LEQWADCTRLDDADLRGATVDQAVAFAVAHGLRLDGDPNAGPN
jgi:hypothetical protein